MRFLFKKMALTSVPKTIRNGTQVPITVTTTSSYLDSVFNNKFVPLNPKTYTLQPGTFLDQPLSANEDLWSVTVGDTVYDTTTTVPYSPVTSYLTTYKLELLTGYAQLFGSTFDQITNGLQTKCNSSTWYQGTLLATKNLDDSLIITGSCPQDQAPYKLIVETVVTPGPAGPPPAAPPPYAPPPPKPSTKMSTPLIIVVIVSIVVGSILIIWGLTREPPSSS